ncbi:ZIP family metal transporter [Bacillus songklensis]|uniref:ZIP family metal transporter n=1 Tax=Bacillus songklensis TaxID=1069116 RepID=A0ABV8B6K2_9BACI
MWNAMLWGGISGSAVLIGALLALLLPIKKKAIAYIMSFGTGILIGAAAYELLGQSMDDAGMKETSIGFLIGAGMFTLFDLFISKQGGENRKRSGENAPGNSGLAIFAGTVMDAIPESIMIGASLIEKQAVSWLLVIAIFMSNIPEGISSTTGLKKSGYSKRKILFLWSSVFVISALGSLGGFTFLEGASASMTAIIASFAGGGIIAMVASTMMPEAYQEGGPVVGLITALGLLTSLALDSLSL